MSHRIRRQPRYQRQDALTGCEWVPGTGVTHTDNHFA
jgi:hypothetical protein